MAILNASEYIYSADLYKSEFEIILSKLITCYNMMIDNKDILPKDENEIRNVLLLNYLKKDIVRDKVGLLDFNFEREVPEGHSSGRTDIKITTIKTFVKQDEYYTIECKLIDNQNPRGTSGLNAKYVANGICRFISGYYHTSSESVNGMIGFVVSEMEISENIDNINYLQTVELRNTDNVLVAPNTIKFLTKTSYIEGFDCQYASEHTTNDGHNIRLYHLMLDYSKNIVR
jgi:hypothetical protein